MSSTHDSHGTHTSPMTPEHAMPPMEHLNKLEHVWKLTAVISGVLALIVMYRVVGQPGVVHEQFFRAYLLGFWPCLGLTLGSLGLLMVQHVTGGKWGVVIRRILEAATRNIYVVFAMILPLFYYRDGHFIALGYLYPWSASYTHPLSEAAKKVAAIRYPWMSDNWVLARLLVLFAIWMVFIYILNKWSLRLDSKIESHEEYEKLRLRFMRLAGGGLVMYSLTMSLAGIDLNMSLDPIFYSTIWGMMYMVGPALGALCFVIINLHILSAEEPMRSFLRKNELHDIGKLLLAFVMLYTYLNWSQFLIIWSGNLLDEIPWYKMRMHEGWQGVTYALVVFHFMVPFIALLNSNLKKDTKKLASVAILLLVMRWVDYYWHIIPNFPDTNPLQPLGRLNLTQYDVILPLAMISIWIAAFYRNLKQRPLIPAYHHLVPEIMEPDHGAH